MKTIREVFKNNLKRLRKARGFRNAEAFARAHDIPWGTYQSAEQGKTIPQPETLAKIADALGVFEVDLFQVERSGLAGEIEKALRESGDESDKLATIYRNLLDVHRPKKR